MGRHRGTNIGLVPRDHADILDLLRRHLDSIGDAANPITGPHV